MQIELRLPNITQGTPEEQLQQLKRYLYTTVEQLNFYLPALEKVATQAVQNKNQISSSKEKTDTKSAETFGEIKDLIIKDADIVSAYEEKISKTFSGQYVAQSDFGKYKEEVTSKITESASGLRVDINATSEVATSTKSKLSEIQGYVNIGILGTDKNGDQIIGVEIKNGTASDVVFARYTASGTVLYNETGNEAVTLADGKTKLTGKVTIESGTAGEAALKMEKYLLDPNDGLGLYWVG